VKYIEPVLVQTRRIESYDPIASRVPSGLQSSDVKSPCPAFEAFSIISGSPGISAKFSDLGGGGSGKSQRLTVPSFDLISERDLRIGGCEF